MVGSYSSTKWLWMNWIVSADFPTPGTRTLSSECEESTAAQRTTAADDNKLVLPQELSLYCSVNTSG